jgi:hypothetical protein
MMRPSCTLSSAVLLVAFFLAACSPTFNWREVRPENTRLTLLLPCKPDKAQKKVPLGGQPTELALLGCDAGDLTFAVASADLGDTSRVGPVLAQWQAATLANMKAAPAASGAAAARLGPLKVPGADALPTPVLVVAQGQRADGSPVAGQAAYFAQGSKVFQVVVYGKQIKPELADTFYSSLKLE